MLYQDIGYNCEIYNKLQTIKTKINAPNCRLFWRSSSSNYNLLSVLAGLAYFTGINVSFKTTKLGRNDHIPYIFDAIERNMQPSRFEGIEAQMYDDDTPYTNIIVNLVHIPYQITASFEQAIPEYVRAQNYTELNAFSLALKTSPRHRIRVYSRTDIKSDVPVKIITIFSATAYSDDNYLLLRKIAAILPLLVSDTDADVPETSVLKTRVPLFRMLETTEDATVFLNAVSEYLHSLPAFVDLETLETINTLQNLNVFHKRNVERQINALNISIQTEQNTLRDLFIRQRDLQYELAGMSDTSLTPDDLKMLINKKIINNPKLENESLIYVCKAPCLSFDKNAAKAYYNRLGDKQSNFARLFKLAFIDEKIILNFEDVIKIDFRNLSFTGRNISSSYNYTARGFRNPHHRHFDCWGNYSTTIVKLIQQYDFVQLFLQIKAAVGSINLVDYTVLNRFHEDINTHIYNECYHPDRYDPIILWKEEQDSTKFHTIQETLTQYKTGDADNETN